jgi:hypothetical protein
VIHRSRGPGTVLAVRFGGEAKVRLDAEPGLLRTVPVEELCVEGESASGGGEGRNGNGRVAEARALTPIELASLRQALEALRLGVVPAEHVRDYTVARDAQLDSIEALLAEGRGMRVVWGDYGAGKTHLVDLAERIGRERGFLTARVVLDPNEVPPTQPLRLYRAIVEHLSYPDDLGQGLEPLARKLLDSPSHDTRGGRGYSRFYSPFVFALRHGDPDLLDWMRDYVDGCYMDAEDGIRQLARAGWRGERLLTMSEFRTYGRMYVHLVGTIAAWAQDAGYRGLLLLFDEVEYVESISRYERGYALEVLQHYAAVTVPRADLGFDPDALYKGGHVVHRAIPMAFRERQPLSVVFAMTPLEDIRALFAEIVRTDAHGIELPPLGSDHCLELADKIKALYLRAHPSFSPSDAELERVRATIVRALSEGETSPRTLVGATVSGLDRVRRG